MTRLHTYLVIGGVAVLGVWYLKNKAGEAIQAVNPASRDNIVYTNLNRALSDDPSFSLGSWVYDVFHPEEG